MRELRSDKAMISFCPKAREMAPALSPAIVHVWRAQLSRFEDATAWNLSPAESERLGRFRFRADAHREAVSRSLLRSLLSGYLGIASLEIEFSQGPYGKPMLGAKHSGVPIEFNVSHSGDWILLAFGEGSKVGVDVERHVEIDVLNIAEVCFDAREYELFRRWPDRQQAAAFFGIWTLKESYLKALGRGLSKSPASFGVRYGDALTPAVAWCADFPDASMRWRLHQLNIGGGYSAALATETGVDEILAFELT